FALLIVFIRPFPPQEIESHPKHPPLLDHDGMVAPFFQFDRQAPGRISTSPTLRRMRSTRRPVLDSQDPARMGSTQEEPSMACLSSPLHRVKSPLAAGGQICHEHPPISSCGRQRTRSHRSKTFDNGIASMKPQCRSAHPTVMKGFGFPDSELQVSGGIFVCKKKKKKVGSTALVGDISRLCLFFFFFFLIPVSLPPAVKFFARTPKVILA
uniref:Uncharacterized protein n=1 Tax=Hippocampus comes TaxID=109280 RepID=A0A3Q2XV53_HIPCM